MREYFTGDDAKLLIQSFGLIDCNFLFELIYSNEQTYQLFLNFEQELWGIKMS